MAFTEAQKLDIGGVMGIDQIVLQRQLDTYAVNITEAVEERVIELIASYKAVADNYVRFTPTESNEGFNLNPTEQKTSIRNEIARLLFFDPAAMFGWLGAGRSLRS